MDPPVRPRHRRACAGPADGDEEAHHRPEARHGRRGLVAGAGHVVEAVHVVPLLQGRRCSDSAGLPRRGEGCVDDGPRPRPARRPGSRRRLVLDPRPPLLPPGGCRRNWEDVPGRRSPTGSPPAPPPTSPPPAKPPPSSAPKAATVPPPSTPPSTNPPGNAPPRSKPSRPNSTPSPRGRRRSGRSSRPRSPRSGPSRFGPSATGTRRSAGNSPTSSSSTKPPWSTTACSPTCSPSACPSSPSATPTSCRPSPGRPNGRPATRRAPHHRAPVRRQRPAHRPRHHAAPWTSGTDVERDGWDGPPLVGARRPVRLRPGHRRPELHQVAGRRAAAGSRRP
jgi:hypothetical protein